MAYQKTEWKAGDLITAERLKNNEDQTEANAKAIEDLQDVPAPTIGIKSIDFQTDADGKVTGVTVTGTDGKPITATVTATPAQA